ncbi:MAG: peptidylprolyl isomerase [Bdellovibrionaceae bacterium]|nr:peptidylprolyl isomerase [Pseudobdellovibrionaceae bacterium]
MIKSRVFLSLFSVLFALPTRADVVERVIAVVNNEPILEFDLRELQERARHPDLLYPFLMTTDASVMAKGDRKALMNYLIGERLLSSEVKRLNMEVPAEKVEQEIRSIAKRNQMSVDDLYQQIRREGLSKAQYQDMMKSNMERQTLLEQEVVSKIRVTDDDALAEYMRQHPEARVSINEFTVSHIFFDPKKGGAEAAYDRAQDVAKKIGGKQSFENLAQQFSEDPNFSAGGSLGTFKTGEFLKEIEDSIASLSPGQTTPVVKSRLGFHIVKLNGKKMAQDPRFEKEKERIKSRLLENIVQRQFRLWLQTKKDDSYIRINEP